MNTLRVGAVAAKIGIHPRTVWDLVRTQDFPKPFKLAPRITVWDEAEVDRWLQAKKGDTCETQ